MSFRSLFSDLRRPSTLPRVALGAAAFALALPASGAAQSIELGFGWTPGMTADVRVENLTDTETAGQTFSVSLKTAHTLSVGQTEGGLSIDFSDFELLESESPMGPMPMPDAALEAGQPDIVVGEDGTFIDLQDAEARVAEMRASMQGDTSIPPQMAGMFEEMFDIEAMRNTAREQWRSSVGWWVGRTLTVGENASFTVEQEIPVGEGLMMSVDVEISIAGIVDCMEGSGAGDCVELVAIANPSEESLASAMDQLLSQLSAQMGEMAGQVSISDWSLTTETRLVAEPATLIPHRSASTVEQNMTMAMMGMNQVTWTINQTSTEYDWSGR